MVPDQELPPSPEQLASLRQSFLEMVKERGKDLFEDTDVARFHQAIAELQSNLMFTDFKATIDMRKSSGSMVSSFRVRTGSGTQQVTSFFVTSLLLLRAVLAVEALLWRKEFGVASITEDCLDRGLLDSGSLYSRGRDKQGGRLLILSVRR